MKQNIDVQEKGGRLHRELQNVVYMKKKSMFKKKGGGFCPQVPVK
jgi:hypothetical protein